MPSRFQPRLPYCKDDLYAALKTVDPVSAQGKRILTLMKVQGEGPCFHVYYGGKKGLPFKKVYALSGKRIPLDWDELKREGIQYFGLTRLKEGYPSDKLLQKLKKNGKLLARFSPYRNPKQEFSSDPVDLTGAPTTLRDLRERVRNGHLIEIYKLKR